MIEELPPEAGGFSAPEMGGKFLAAAKQILRVLMNRDFPDSTYIAFLSAKTLKIVWCMPPE